MKSISQFKQASRKDTMRSGFHGYLHVSYPELVDKFGEPHDCTQEGGEQSADV
jgi:hypothetical protein